MDVPEILDAPATRWDRLVSVLEDVDPSLVIRATYFIGRKKAMKLSDVEFFYYLAVCYQNTHSKVLCHALHLNVLSESWIDWLRQLHSSLKGYALLHDIPLHYCHVYPDQAADSQDEFQRKLRMFISKVKDAKRPLSCDSNTNSEDLEKAKPLYPKCCEGEKEATILNHILEADSCRSIVEYLRDGEFLCQLLMDIIELKGTLRPQRYASSPTGMSYQDLFPPLEALDNNQPDSPIFTARKNGGTCTTTKMMSAHDKAEFFIKSLNDMCRHFLGATTDLLDPKVFNPTVNGVLKTRHELDGLQKLHWLAIALYKYVGDDTIIPYPPTAGLIISNDQTLPKTQIEEEDEMEFQIATSVSCLPHDIGMEVMFKDRYLQCRNTKNDAAPLKYSCVMLKGETYVYLGDYKIFVPLPRVLKCLLHQWEGIRWTFGTGKAIRQRLKALNFCCPEQSSGSSWKGSDQQNMSSGEEELHESLLFQDEGGVHQSKDLMFNLTVHKSAMNKAPSVSSEVSSAGVSDSQPLIGVCSLSPCGSEAAKKASSDTQSLSDMQNPSFSMTDDASFQRRTVSGTSDLRSEDFSATIVCESQKTGIDVNAHQFRIRGNFIGKGAFGAVFKALDLETGAFVAVKQSRFSFERGKEHLNWNEFQLWSMLPPHQNLISFRGASIDECTNQILLVLEYASGGSIASLYKNYGPISESLHLVHAREIAYGLNHLHAYHVFHGDLKPENVLCRSDGSVAISDFGCSRVMFRLTHSNRPEDEDSSPSSLMLAGTISYMAPEVPSKPDLCSDVWAYACTLMHLWTGEAPWSRSFAAYDDCEPIALLFHIASTEGALPYTPQQLQTAPEWLQKICMRAFVRDPSKRCSMREILTILAEWE